MLTCWYLFFSDWVGRSLRWLKSLAQQLHTLSQRWGCCTAMHQRSLTSYTPPPRPAHKHKCKTNLSTIFACHVAFHMGFIFISCSDCSRCSHTHLTNRSYFDYKKNHEDPQFEPNAGIMMVQVLRTLVYIPGCISVGCCQHGSNALITTLGLQQIVI